jgi:GNAT superfamily N-acetyltransferase
VRVQRADLDGPVARALIGTLNAELTATYPEAGATHFRLDAEEVAAGRGAFLVATRGGRPVGCGAVRRIDASTAELKRMYVERALRGQGLGRRLLEALEREARSLGVERLVLETGVRQDAALALYERAGYTRIPPWGEYRDTPLSLCMEKRL